MFHKILVAIDQSAMGKQVFEQALELAKVNNASLMLLHVLSHEEENSPKLPVFSGLDYYPGVMRSQTLELYQQHWETYEQLGLKMLRSRAQEAAEVGVTVEFSQNSGSPGHMICEVANLWNADLIVVGRRGRSGLSELLLGSVSNYVLHHAGCSVLIVNRPAPTTSEELPAQQSEVIS